MKKSRATKKDEGPLTRRESLGFRPVKNLDIKERRMESGLVMLSYPMGMRPWIRSLVQRFGGKGDSSYEKKIQLDELGSAVWDMIDGQKTVRRIIEEFSGKYGLNSREAETSVTHFMRILGKRGLIGMK